MNMSDFELLLREQTIREWRDLEIYPHDAHVSSRVEDISNPFWRAHRESDWLVG